MKAKVKAIEWIVSRDTGVSSEAIWAYCMGVKPRWGFQTPLDIDDFGRCVRLLVLIPEWKTKLKNMAMEHPNWAKLIENWNEIEKLYWAWEVTDRNSRSIWDKSSVIIQEAVK